MLGVIGNRDDTRPVPGQPVRAFEASVLEGRRRSAGEGGSAARSMDMRRPYRWVGFGWAELTASRRRPGQAAPVWPEKPGRVRGGGPGSGPGSLRSSSLAEGAPDRGRREGPS